MNTLIGRMPSTGLQASQIFIIGLAVASRGWATYRLPYCAAPATPPTRQGAAPCSIAICWTRMYSGQIPMETESAAESAAERYKNMQRYRTDLIDKESFPRLRMVRDHTFIA